MDGDTGGDLRGQTPGPGPDRRPFEAPREGGGDLETKPPRESGLQLAADHPDVQEAIDELITRVNGRPASKQDQRQVREMITAALKLIPDGRDTGELKLMAAATKELRYAYRVFGQYPEPFKVSIFGSARTPADHPDYKAAVEYGRQMAKAGWMIITGAGGGIMQAGHEGPGRAASFGVAIRLPFEQQTNEIIRGDEKLINFRYFFTRKLIFLSQSEAVVCFPGGFGTMDEAFETLTLIQTGKAPIIPLVLVEGRGDNAGYWRGFDDFVRAQLLGRGMISEDDLHLYHIAETPDDATRHVLGFYRNYHSCRYVRNELVIRTRHALRPEHVEELNDRFGVLLAAGKIRAAEPFPVEESALELPRLAFEHNRRHFGVLRSMIDRINTFDLEPRP